MTLVCTVLPTFNERDNMAALIEGILTNAITSHMVLVVDDNSPDGTADVVRAVASRYNTVDALRVALYVRTGQKGLTSAIQCGIDFAVETFGADIVTWMDCDLSMPPADVAQLVQAIVDDGAELAVGSRWIEGGDDVAHGLMERTLSRIINGFAVSMIGAQVHDYTSGFIGGRSDLLRTLRLRGDYGEYCIDLLARAVRSGYNVKEVPYVCVPRTAGESKTGVNLWDYLVKGRKYVATIWRLSLN
ncbi:MAG: polyprenol monophosphomannose synthase [Caldilinea sp.]